MVMIGNQKIDGKLFLSPMAGVTDKPFRLICRELGCRFAFTEMVSAKGLCYGGGSTKSLTDIDEGEKVGLQIFGSDPDIMGLAAKKLSFGRAAVIDINMGCPTPKIVKGGDGCALMLNIDLASDIIKAVAANTDKPVTVKIRKGWDDKHINAVEFACMAEQSGAKAVSVHGRTREQFYSGKADWDIIKKVKDSVKIPVFGNGDVFTPYDAKAMFDETGCDAILIARGAQGNPWIFSGIENYLKTGTILPEPSDKEKIDMILKQLKMSVELKGEHTGVCEMRKHIGWYIKGIRNSTRIRETVNSIPGYKELSDFLKSIKRTL